MVWKVKGGITGSAYLINSHRTEIMYIFWEGKEGVEFQLKCRLASIVFWSLVLRGRAQDRRPAAGLLQADVL
jgi:hypothetical protein